MKKLAQKGFAQTELVLIAVISILVVSVGLYVYKANVDSMNDSQADSKNESGGIMTAYCNKRNCYKYKKSGTTRYKVQYAYSTNYCPDCRYCIVVRNPINRNVDCLK